MSDTTTTNGVNLPAPVVQMREQLPTLLTTFLPKMEIQKQNAAEALETITKPKNKEEFEEHMETLVAVRDVYKSNNAMRKQMTEITDAFKDTLMAYERDFDPDSKKSKYSEKHALLVQWQDEERERIRLEQAKLAKQKELENLKVDLRAKVQKALADNVVDTVRRADEYARQLFATLEPDNFDAQAEKFKHGNSKLRIEFYNKCFEVPEDLMPRAKQYFQPSDFTEFTQQLQQEEPYEKWNNAVKEAVAPVLNEWRARIPDLKAECIKRHNASAEEKKRLEDEKKQKDEHDRQQREQQLNMFQQSQSQKIEEQAQLDKMSNSFAEQGAGQELGDAGKIKMVLKFVDAKTAPKAFLQIIGHSLANPKFATEFPGFQRRDKSKKLMYDQKGRPIYIEPVQWWIDWFLNNCDGQPEGVVIHEDSKITVR